MKKRIIGYALLPFLLATTPVMAGEDLKTILGGGAGGAAGSLIGRQMGGDTGALVGAALGGAAGGAVTANRGNKNEAALGGAVGAVGGAALGKEVGGLRLPLCEMSEGNLKILSNSMTDYGLL